MSWTLAIWHQSIGMNNTILIPVQIIHRILQLNHFFSLNHNLDSIGNMLFMIFFLLI
jgi:hypothetical protein